MTIRTPAASAAARLVKAFVQQKGAELTYAQCLDVVAIAHGYKNAMHMNGEPRSDAVEADKPFVRRIIFSTEQANAWDEADAYERRHLVTTGAVDVVEVSFATESELSAYLEGINQAIGFLDHTEIEPEDWMSATADVSSFFDVEAVRAVVQRVTQQARAALELPTSQRDIEAAEAYDRSNADLEWLEAGLEQPSAQAFVAYLVAYFNEPCNFEDFRGEHFDVETGEALQTARDLADGAKVLTAADDRAFNDLLQRLVDITLAGN